MVENDATLRRNGRKNCTEQIKPSVCEANTVLNRVDRFN